MAKCWTLVKNFSRNAIAVLVNSNEVDYDSSSIPHRKIFGTRIISRKTLQKNDHENLDL
jgi:hypothetical protein